MKKKLLFVIPSLSAGGAEKSLVNLLSTLDASRYSVDLFMFAHEGLFRNQLPEWVRILPKNTDLIDFQKPLLSSILTFIKKRKLLLAKNRVQYFLKNQFNFLAMILKHLNHILFVARMENQYQKSFKKRLTSEINR